MAEVELPSDPLAVLAAAKDRVTLGAFGYMAAMTPEAYAFEALARDVPSHVDHLRLMLVLGTPAARCYAACLLAKLGPEQARAAWRGLLDCEHVVEFCPGGCIYFRCPVREIGQQKLLEMDQVPPRGTALRLWMIMTVFWSIVVAFLCYRSR